MADPNEYQPKCPHNYYWKHCRRCQEEEEESREMPVNTSGHLESDVEAKS